MRSGGSRGGQDEGNVTILMVKRRQGHGRSKDDQI